MNATMDLLHDGYTIVRGAVSPDVCALIAREIDAVFATQSEGAIEARRGSLIGGRNLLQSWAGWREITDHPELAKLIIDHVGAGAGLVRILYFDKPPGQSWSLSLHRDKTIAVAQHHSPAEPFAKPTRKADVPHVEANESLLEQMLTLRLHLDPMCDENGPLVIIPGSHLERSQETGAAVDVIHCNAGDVFVMRPLLLHGSRAALPETSLHRRVVHLEIAPSQQLPGPYCWHQFESLVPGLLRGDNATNHDGS